MAEAPPGRSLTTRFRPKIEELFGADLRALAAFRVALALLVLASLATRGMSLTALYTDDGVLPRWLLLGMLSEWQISINLVSGTAFFQGVLFGVTGLAAAALLVGYRTRLATVAVWVLFLSIQWRNPYVVSGADILLRVLLFWAIFLPLGACWSVDRARRPATAPVSTRFLSWATAALFLQIAFMYWFTAIQKSGDEWRRDGTALYYSLSAEHVTTRAGAYLTRFPGALEVLSFGVLALELVGPALLFFPVWTALVRTLAVAALMSLQLGIMVTMDVGLFPWVSALCMLCFLPRAVWDAAGAKVGAVVPNRSVLMLRYRHVARRFAAVDPTPLRVVMPRPIGLGHHGDAVTEAHASVERQSGIAETSGAVPAPPVAPMAAGSVRLRSSPEANLAAIFFLLYVVLWNVTTVSAVVMPEAIRPLGELLGLRQNWSMFAPSPATVTHWFVMPGTLASGRQVDLIEVALHGEPSRARELLWERPESLDAVYRNSYWRKYLDTIKDSTARQRELAWYVCREWNAVHPEASRLTSVELVFVRQPTLPDQRRGAIERNELSMHSCA